MRFGGHQSFHLRDHWLSKGAQGVQRFPALLFNPQKSMEQLGVGKNMMESIRYWLTATQLIKEGPAGGLFLTDIAKKIMEKDPYFELDGSLFLIHYLLASNKKSATTWHWFFNHFSAMEFDKESLTSAYCSYISIQAGKKIKDTTLDKDLSCLLRMYQSIEWAGKKNPETETPSPFVRYGWIEKKGDRFIRNKLSLADFDPDMFAYIFYIFWKSGLGQAETVKLDEWAHKENSIGRIFLFTLEELADFIESLSSQTNYWQYSRTGGYLIVRPNEKSLKEALDNYYQKINIQ